MSDPIAAFKQRLSALQNVREELNTIRKEAFMAAPPMPGGGGGGMPPGMDPAMMQGGMPPGMDPSMMQGGMPPGMDPSMMQGGMPPGGMPVDPNTGMPMDPSMMGGPPPGGDPTGGSPITPEMLEELMGVIEGIAASSEEHEKALQQLAQQTEECLAKCDELEQVIAQLSAAPAPGAGGF